MKPILIALLALSCTTARAQKIEIGANFGGLYNPTLHGKGSTPVAREEKTVKASPLFNLKGSYNNGNWQMGMSVGVNTISGQYRLWDMMTIHEGPSFAYQMYDPRYEITYIQYLAFLNRKVTVGKFAMYGGVSFGGTERIMTAGEWSDVTSIKNATGLRPAYVVAMQAGGRYAVTKHIGINAEISANYMNLGNKLYILSYPVAAGVSYGF